jgi:hypothetical protein
VVFKKIIKRSKPNLSQSLCLFMVLSLSLLISIPIQPLFSFRLAGTRSPPFPLVGPFLSRPSSHHNPCCDPTSSPLPPLLSFWPSRLFFFSLASLLSLARLWPSSHTRPTKQLASLAPSLPLSFSSYPLTGGARPSGPLLTSSCSSATSP